MDNFTKQQKEALQYSNHSIVTANAGSGKTKVFSFRFVNIALGVTLDENNKFVKVTDTPPDIQKLVAITYTDKAASELYTRIVAEIDSRIENEKDSEIQKKLYRLRREIISANISTIHSFCMKLLKKFPIKAKLDPNFTPVDSRISDELIEESTIELYEKLNREEASQDLRYLIRIFGGKDLFTKALQAAVNKRTDIIDLAQLYSKPEEEIAKFFSDSFYELRSRIIPAEKIEWLKNSLAVINKAVLKENKNGSTPHNNALAMVQILDHLTDIDSIPVFIDVCREDSIINGSSITFSARSYLSKTLKEELNACEVEEFLAFANGFAVATEEEKNYSELELAVLGKKFLSVFNELNAIYQRKKDENGFLDFEDLLLKARDLIKDDNVCEDLKKEIDYIMIDEYQDTNQLQYDLFIPILSELNAKLSRGNLFVVGDEKQSIYMFRNADLKIFNNTHADIVNHEGKNIQLPHSFRMAYNNCLFTNVLFSRLFTPNITEEGSLFNEVANAPLICGIGKDTSGIVEFGFVKADEEKDLNEGDLAALRILKLLSEPQFKVKDRNPEYRDVAVLCRKRDSFTVLEEAFVKYKIPYLIIGGQGFYSSQIVKDFYNYLSFLLNNEDDRALAGILRSPFFSLPDSSLYEISVFSYDSLWTKLNSYNKIENLREELSEITTVLKENIEYAKCYPPAYVIRKILSESPYAGVISARENGVQDNANLEKLINIAHNYASGGLNSLYDFIDFLKDSIENNPDENQAAVVSDQNCVKIMTVHQSKGLEFPAVFLFGCDKVGMNTSTKSKSVNVSREYGILTKVPGKSMFEEYLTPPVCSVYDHIQKKREEAELKRLLYVAVTRAANFLFISACYKINKDGSINFKENSFMDLLEKGLLPDKKFMDYFADGCFNITGDISYKVSKDSDETAVDKNVTLAIPFINEIENTSPVEMESGKMKCEVLLDKVLDYFPSGEIMTATRYADFINDPDVYYNKYILGLEQNLISSSNAGRSFGALKGSVMHYFLAREESPSKQDITEIIAEISGSAASDETTELADIIFNELNNYYNSKSYECIKNYDNCKNEYELWYFNKEHSYFMHGFLDKVIFNSDEIIILDYKTNSIKKNEIQKTADSYLPQLQFYAVLLSKLNCPVCSFRLKIVFTKFPDCEVEWKMELDELKTVEQNITGSVLKLRKTVTGDENRVVN